MTSSSSTSDDKVPEGHEEIVQSLLSIAEECIDETTLRTLILQRQKSQISQITENSQIFEIAE